MKKYPYGLYLDSKIIGTALQIVAFYTNGVFDRKQTIVYVKKYKVTAKKYQNIFEEAGIPFKFILPRELDVLDNQIIFYPFNAQSNCRLVANRKLQHVFITHGESNKVASIKPIIRIYDYVIMSGDLSVERYLQSGLFTQQDVSRGRLIKMGDTFIGRTGFAVRDDDTAEQVICYAPTWEGGLESENYSSLGSHVIVKALLRALTEHKNIKLVLKPHPNIGHRCPVYIGYLYKLLKKIKNTGVDVLIYGDKKMFSLLFRSKIKLLGIKWLHTPKNYRPILAFSDVSAMETQFINEKIPYRVFFKKSLLSSSIPQMHLELYKLWGINLEDLDIISPKLDSTVMPTKFVDSTISFTSESIRHVSLPIRVSWLSQFVQKG